MHHPNIIKLYDFYFEYNESAVPNKSDRLFLIMEYLPMNLIEFMYEIDHKKTYITDQMVNMIK